ncbi:stalk domain-containing protein [Paenibacillus sp. FJAT-26967]|uniref:stalk domain-containing protein n=1 Tax=Paenibacillus sp. FJAT-26967 TaxID=1729690 RepID=UPI0008390F07|nr:stalk domain-containing protein [Paenibacillus sp. FJAT-26967]
MKKWILAGGLSAALLVGATVGAYAASNLDVIQAYLNKSLQVEVNGIVSVMKDEQGNELQPITYEGNTYLPARSIASALDVEVSWDGANNRVTLTDRPYITVSEDEAEVLNQYGYTFQIPAWVQNLRLDILSDENLKTIQEDSNLDKRVQSVVFVQYMIQDENVHRLHDEIARIEVYKAADWVKKKTEPGAGAVLKESGQYVYTVVKAEKPDLEAGTRDAKGYEDLSAWLSLQNYYLNLTEK